MNASPRFLGKKCQLAPGLTGPSEPKRIPEPTLWLGDPLGSHRLIRPMASRGGLCANVRRRRTTMWNV
ncbi:hypothetical protein BDZ89DRAFT_1069463 [Hymenopellis radicata]|nr:hypothetical protein BDZ89DRAFT_1069463 [Hymenopellis radicata]